MILNALYAFSLYFHTLKGFRDFNFYLFLFSKLSLIFFQIFASSVAIISRIMVKLLLSLPKDLKIKISYKLIQLIIFTCDSTKLTSVQLRESVPCFFWRYFPDVMASLVLDFIDLVSLHDSLRPSHHFSSRKKAELKRLNTVIEEILL